MFTQNFILFISIWKKFCITDLERKVRSSIRYLCQFVCCRCCLDVLTCLNWTMMSLESSMSLNIPSNLLVKAAPHSEETPETTVWILISVIKRSQTNRTTELTVLELWQHGFLGVNRSTLSHQQPFGQILFIKGLKNVFPCKRSRWIRITKHSRTDTDVGPSLTVDESKDDHDLVQHLLQFFVCGFFVSRS